MAKTPKRKPKQTPTTHAAPPLRDEVEVTAIELAQLTANLVSAKLIPVPVDDVDPSENEANWNHSNLIFEALKFLQTCRDAQSTTKTGRGDEREEIKEKLGAYMLDKLREHGGNKVDLPNSDQNRVPTDIILQIAKVDRIVLTSTELESIELNKQWEKLSTSQQTAAKYVLLAKLARGNSMRLFGYPEKCKKDAIDGICAMQALDGELILALRDAKRLRDIMQKRVAGKKAKLKKQRAVKKQRAADGTFSRAQKQS
jgi:hypothetical protein